MPLEISPSDRRSVVVLGSTGSIGTQAIEVIQRNHERFGVEAICAGGQNRDLLARQALDLDVNYVGIAEAGAAERFGEAFRAQARRRGIRPPGRAAPEVFCGPDAAARLAALPCDGVLHAITGSVGLKPTLAALESGNMEPARGIGSATVAGHSLPQALPLDRRPAVRVRLLRPTSHPEGARRHRRHRV